MTGGMVARRPRKRARGSVIYISPFAHTHRRAPPRTERFPLRSFLRYARHSLWRAYTRTRSREKHTTAAGRYYLCFCRRSCTSPVVVAAAAVVMTAETDGIGSVPRAAYNTTVVAAAAAYTRACALLSHSRSFSLLSRSFHPCRSLTRSFSLCRTRARAALAPSVWRQRTPSKRRRRRHPCPLRTTGTRARRPTFADNFRKNAADNDQSVNGYYRRARAVYRPTACARIRGGQW